MIKYFMVLDNVIKFYVLPLHTVERCFVKHALIHDVINRNIILRWPSHDFMRPLTSLEIARALLTQNTYKYLHNIFPRDSYFSTVFCLVGVVRAREVDYDKCVTNTCS